MGKGRHASAPRPTLALAATIAGTASESIGTVLLLIALDKLIRYSPYGDPQAGRVGFTLLGISALLIAVPILVIIGCLIIRGVRQWRAWSRALSPEQRMMLRFAETAAMEGAHIALRDHNRREDARLSASVIGTERNSNDEQQA
jgi:hypothetical protein